ncbi:MAG TPA: LysM peptidoglycan-binding domain-containing protein [Gemmatimonadaceae bacterium]|nr:LysM peptidoglycan-binding domain-containing protein [Gemmatimonadaceae bacterium]
MPRLERSAPVKRRPALHTLRLTRAALLALVMPAIALAQEATERRTHVVKTGDTLWDLAGAYLSDPFLWPEIYRINTDVVEDPHWIYPGEVLQIPGPGELTVAADQPLPVEQGVEDQRPVGPTIFARAQTGPTYGSRKTTASRRVETPDEVERAAVREGEFIAAPWMDRDGGPQQHGRIVATAEMAGIAQASDPIRLSPQDRIYVRLPRDVGATVGERYLSYELGPSMPQGQIVVPTGILVVEKVGTDEATLVRIERMFGEVKIGNRFIPLERIQLPTDARPAPVDLGVRSRVIWIASKAVLPSVQHYLMIDASRKDGVSLGDQFTLMRGRVELDGRVRLPEQPVALAQVVRVTERGATVMIVDQVQPKVREGMEARLTAKMP